MTIMITGGAGYLGSAMVREMLDRKDAGRAPIGFDRIVSIDLHACPVADPRVRSVVGDFASPEMLAGEMTDDVVGVVHLAAVLSGESEVSPDRAYRVNVDGTRALLAAAARLGSRPRFVFTSSLAVYGGELPATVPDAWPLRPASAYGALKAIGELLVAEHHRRGLVDARICRLPTIAVRPGRPN